MPVATIRIFIAVAFITFLLIPCSAQTESDTSTIEEFNLKRLAWIASSETALASGSLVLLHQYWYKDFPKSGFHLFNDNDEWLLMDKVGHTVTAYNVGLIGVEGFKWCGLEEKKAVWMGGSLGVAYLSAVEIMDGYSAQWGFSIGDFASNLIGGGMLISQELIWKEQRIKLKYSFRESSLASYRPDLLGDSFVEQALKDYNGQTYWLSANLSSFIARDNRLPKWLNIAFGYGVDGLLGAKYNPLILDDFGNVVNRNRHTQYYLSFDVDLSRIETNSPFVKVLFGTLSFIKIPLPAIGFSRNGVEGLLFGF